MLDVMAEDDKVFAVTAAMGPGTGVDKLIQKFPGRTLDTGICESHAMDMCAGLAKVGLKPFFAVYSTFAQRAFDQVFQEVALQGLPVRVCMDRAGYVGGDGAVHHGFMDVSMFRVFPDVVLLSPIDEPTLKGSLRFMANYDAAASFVRYPRDNVAEKPVQDNPPVFELGKANLIRAAKGAKPDVAILAYGIIAYNALAAADQLAEQGYDVAVYDARFAKPVDINLLRELVEQGTPIITIEENALAGGFGSAVLEACNELHISTDQITRLGMPMKWVYQDSRKSQLAEVGLDVAGIARSTREAIDRAASRAESQAVPVGK
jgi:1-deoxy-D-xylulose-5-phosphate synthase